MKAEIGGIGAALVASACCVGPVAFSLIGAGALGASAVKVEPYRPWFIAFTVLLVGVAFYGAYRRLPAAETCENGACSPHSRRTARVLAWVAAIVAAILIAFPYYIGWLV
jgi:mercuric ion transport protein